MPIASPWAKRTALLAGLGAAAAVWSALDGYAKTHMFMINRSESLPNWAFFVERGTAPKVGDTVFFVPPRAPLVIAHFGREPAPFGKIVYGQAGDEVAHHGRAVLLRRSGRRDWNEIGAMKPTSLRGEPLEAGPIGVIPRGCFYVGTPHKDGLDSRYKAIGFVCRDRLIGVAEATLL